MGCRKIGEIKIARHCTGQGTAKVLCMYTILLTVAILERANCLYE